ncbi:uncharacterized protein [Clytia hemisphaerica]|uniref:uncharacterized protein n=1 Tax=Clytia hemisphaerica TaxID=252671 RepID=UPI0034D78F09
MRDFHIALTNKVGLHKCNNTCLNEKSDGAKTKYCRFHFGKFDIENRTSEGKETHPFHSLIKPGEHPRFEGNRDHSFLISHVKTRLLTWLANSDTQAIIDQDLMALLRYITQYACKGAKSTDDFIRLYKHLLDVNSDVASVRSIAQQLILKIIGLIDMPAAAVDFLNCGGRLFHCTRQFRRIGLSGFRAINSKFSDGDATKETPLEKFLSEKRRIRYPNMTLYNWAQICVCTPKCAKNHVPVFTGIPTLPIWPLEEDYCKGQLMIHSLGTWENVNDLKNGKDSYLESFMEFLESDLCPMIVKELVKKKKLEHDKKLERDRQRAKKRKNLDVDDSSIDHESGSEDEFENEIRNEHEFLRYLAENRPQDFEDLNAFRDLPDGGEGFDWHQYAIESFGGAWPDNASDWLENISKVAAAQQQARNQNCDLPPNIDLLKANALQRVIIAINIFNIMSVVNNEHQNKVRLLVQGTAGSGKTFTIVALTYLSRRICNRNNAVMNLAPTGAASILLPLGRTVHSTTNIPRVKRKESKTLQLTDKPLNSISLTALRELTGSTLEGNSMKLMTLNLDERGMYSHRMLAWCSQRFKEATCDFFNNFGAIPTVNFFGDLGQLGPVDSHDLHVEPLSSDAPDKLTGYGIYRTFSHCILLNETMRQGPDQLSFLEMLLRIREGKLNLNDWKTINSRYEGELPESAKEGFRSDTCLTVMETWQEVNVENHNKLADLGIPVATIPSKGKGRHHTQSVNQMGQIPATSHIAVGSRVLLTKNQLSLTPLGLNNGAIGKVIAILYAEGEAPPSFPEAVVVDFPRYKGPSWLPEHPTWVPIPVNEARCDTNCCSRRGFPLMPGYCIPISKSQGMTIGPNEPCTHIRIKLNKEIFMEKLNLGITYTALSRASKLENVALVEKVPYDRLNYINNHPWMPRRREVEERLKILSGETLQTYGHYSDLNTYRELLCEFDRFVNDGLTCFEDP